MRDYFLSFFIEGTKDRERLRREQIGTTGQHRGGTREESGRKPHEGETKEPGREGGGQVQVDGLARPGGTRRGRDAAQLHGRKNGRRGGRNTADVEGHHSGDRSGKFVGGRSKWMDDCGEDSRSDLKRCVTWDGRDCTRL